MARDFFAPLRQESSICHHSSYVAVRSEQLELNRKIYRAGPFRCTGREWRGMKQLELRTDYCIAVGFRGERAPHQVDLVLHCTASVRPIRRRHVLPRVVLHPSWTVEQELQGHIVSQAQHLSEITILLVCNGFQVSCDCCRGGRTVQGGG